MTNNNPSSPRLPHEFGDRSVGTYFAGGTIGTSK